MSRISKLKNVQPVLAFAANHLDEDLSLPALAARADLSPFHLQRTFSAALGETPKQLTLRLRLSEAAAKLLSGDDSVLDIAISCGFQSHEVFCRAFRRRFSMTPSAYRARGFDMARARSHVALVGAIGPCIRLYGISGTEETQRSDMTYSITTREIAPQPVLLARRRVKPSEIAAAIAEVLPKVFLHAQQIGVALVGPPFNRYVEWGPGIMTIEPGMPVAGETSGSGEVVADTLPGGLVASMMHTGAYAKLTESHAAIQIWIDAQGFVATGAPWEVYITDPADFPDPADWKTELFWPVAKRG